MGCRAQLVQTSSLLYCCTRPARRFRLTDRHKPKAHILVSRYRISFQAVGSPIGVGWVSNREAMLRIRRRLQRYELTRTWEPP